MTNEVIKHAFMLEASRLLKKIDTLIDKYDLRDEVLVASMVGVQVKEHEDDEEYGINSFFTFNIADTDELELVMMNMMEVYNDKNIDKGLSDLLNPMGISLN